MESNLRNRIAMVMLPVATSATVACDRSRSGAAQSEDSRVESTTLRGAPMDPGVRTARVVAVDPGAVTVDAVTRAVATLSPTAGNSATGTVRFAASPGGAKIQVVADVQKLPPGRHAFHVHVLGDCSAPDAASAGPHFNFSGSSLVPPADARRILGDLGELAADANGVAKLRATIEHATLQGPYSIIGRAIVVHAGPNDLSKPPDGAAGPRLACGVIGIHAEGIPER